MGNSPQSPALLAAGLGVLLGCGPTDEECAELADGVRACGPSQLQVPLTQEDDQAFTVEVTVDGHEGLMLVDTGAEATVVSSSLLSVADQTMTRVGEICIADLCIRDEAAYAWDTPFSTDASGELNGFFGMRLLHHFGLRFEHGRSLTIRRGGTACRGTPKPLDFSEHGIARIGAEVDAASFDQVALDTGSAYSVLSQATADQLGDDLGAGAEPASICTVDGCEESGAFIASVERYCVAGVCAQDVAVKYPVWDAVGCTYFSRFDLEFDFPSATLWFCDE